MDWILDGSSEWDTGRGSREREASIEKLKRRSRICEEKKSCGAGLRVDIAGLIKTLKLGIPMNEVQLHATHTHHKQYPGSLDFSSVQTNSQPFVGRHAGNHDVLLADKIRLTLEEEERCSREDERETEVRET